MKKNTIIFLIFLIIIFLNSCTEPKTCSQQNGLICDETENCPGDWLTASDTDYCCSEQCIQTEIEDTPEGGLGTGSSGGADITE